MGTNTTQARRASARAIPGRRVSALIAALGLLLAVGASGAETNDGERWLPSLALGMVAHVQDVEGSAASSFPARSAFDPSIRDDPLIVIPSIPIGFQIKAPERQLGGRRIRPFVHGRIQIPMDQDQTIARQGTVPNSVQIPDDLSSTQAASTISGQGTILVSTLDLNGQVGVGIATDIDFLDLPFTLAVSLDYLAEQITLDGLVVYVTGAGPGETEPYTIQRLTALDGLLLHHLGPRFELEAVAAEQGPLLFSVYAEAGMYFGVGDRSTDYSVSDATDTARFEFEADPWLIQAGIGIRVTWRGGEW